MNRPNIIYILTDDLGYGDLGCYNEQGKIPTPHLDAMAQNGMRFTDAHAATSLCTPSRYGILTGQYCWRSRLKQGILWPFDKPLIPSNRPTVASFLQQQGYHTACYGKWHLGWGWTLKDGSQVEDHVPFGEFHPEIRRQLNDEIDYTAPLQGGPTDLGFDHYYGVDVPNFPPYTWFEDDHLVEQPSIPKPENLYGGPGWAVPDWKHEDMLRIIGDKCVDFIQVPRPSGQPFFAYVPLTSPHSPVTPSSDFIGKSGAGAYGDLVCESDHLVGRIVEALQSTGQLDNTLLIFTSDNGPEAAVPDDGGIYERSRDYDHHSTKGLRGIKTDIWEGGHRVPHLVQWPERIAAGTTCHSLISLGDFFATLGDILGVPLPEGSAEDSISFLPLLDQSASQTRQSAVHHSANGKFALRRGPWVYMDAQDPNGGRPAPEWYERQHGFCNDDCPAKLYNLDMDLYERKNLHDQYPEIAAELKTELDDIRQGETTVISSAALHELTE